MNRWILIGAIIASASCYHLAPHLQEEYAKHPTTIDFLRRTNETFNGLLQGKVTKKCVACELFVELLQVFIRMNASQDEIAHLLQEACILLHIEDTRVCYYVIEEFRDEFLTVMSQLLLQPAWLCYAAVGPECGEPTDLFPFWNVTIPGGKPDLDPLVRPSDGLPTLKVVQLSDVHVDLQYTPGSVKHCGEPLCCRHGKSNKTDDQAGFWGSLGADCDIPMRTYENALEFIANEIKPDLLFWTGDVPAHDVWKQSREDQLHHLLVTTEIMSQHLPGVPVFPSLGNHESSPVDSFPPPGVAPKKLNNDWLNQYVQKLWGRWLPPESLPMVGYAGYYAVQYSDKLRIISLNTQYCDNLNFWLYLNNTDPAGQLSWLVQELHWAERAGVKVIILGHIPTGSSDCLKAFSWNYYKIMDRFEGTVVGQYVGHTHKDEFSLMYNDLETPAPAKKRPTSFQFISPSLTTFTDMRPSIRVYTLDGLHGKSTYRPLKSETYLLDLERANENNETVWELEYDSLSAYNMSWIVPDTMQSLYERLSTDRAFFNKTYWKYFLHSSEGEKCDDACYHHQLCSIISGRSHDPTICKDITLAQQQQYRNSRKMC